MSSPPEAVSPADRHKLRTGVDRVWHAAGFSIAGLRAGWAETAFRQEAFAWHDLSRRAKDMGSAAVLLSLVLCGGIWLAALCQRFGR